MDGYILVKFSSKQNNIQIPETQFSLPEVSSVDELNGLLNKLILDSNSKWSVKSFDFLINGFLLRGPLGEFCRDNVLSLEDTVSIDCILREDAPKPEFSLPHEDWVGAVRASNECIISGCYDNTIHVWSKESHLLTIPGHTGPVKCLAWIPTSDSNCKKFVSGSQDQTISVWNYDLSKNSVKCIEVGRGHERSVDCVCSNSDGTRLASGSFDSFLKIWNTDPSDTTTHAPDEQASKKFKTDNARTIVKTPMVTLSGHKEVLSGVCWSDVAEVMTCSWDHTVILWDLELAGQKSSLVGNVAFTSLAYSPLNNLLVTGSCDRHVRLWDPRNKTVCSTKQAYTSHNGWVVAVDWSKTNENLFVSASYDQMMKMWDVRSYKTPLYDLSGHENRLLCCDWSASDQVVSGGADNCVKVFSLSRSP